MTLGTEVIIISSGISANFMNLLLLNVEPRNSGPRSYASSQSGELQIRGVAVVENI